MLCNLEYFNKVLDMTEVFDKIIYICLVVLGFGLLESGCVSTKNEVNIMMKNVVDIFSRGLYILALWIWISVWVWAFHNTTDWNWKLCFRC